MKPFVPSPLQCFACQSLDSNTLGALVTFVTKWPYILPRTDKLCRLLSRSRVQFTGLSSLSATECHVMSAIACKHFQAFSIFIGVGFFILCFVDFCFFWWVACIRVLPWKSVCHSFLIIVVSACICNPQ